MGTEEVWKDVKGYEGIFKVSSLGRIKRIFHRPQIVEKIMKPKSPSQPYIRVTLCVRRNYNLVYLHKLIAEAFLPPVPGKPDVNHKDGNKRNNHIDNLEWCDNRENAMHAILQLNVKHQRKLSDGDVVLIRNMHKAGVSNKELCERFNLSSGAMSHVVNYKTYKWVL